MGRLAKLKRDHIKKVNKDLDEGVKKTPETEELILRPSPNVERGNIKFLNKMKNI